MQFDVVIMNPPYDTNENPIGQNCYNIVCKYTNHVICIMPVRPLQDPVYRCKRHSFYTETVELTIKNTQRMLKIFKAIESDKCFGIASGKDLGIYEHNTKVAGNIDRDDIIIDRIGKIAYSIIKTVIDTNLPSLRKQRREGEKTKYNVWIPRVSGGAEKKWNIVIKCCCCFNWNGCS